MLASTRESIWCAYPILKVASGRRRVRTEDTPRLETFILALRANTRTIVAGPFWWRNRSESLHIRRIYHGRQRGILLLNPFFCVPYFLSHSCVAPTCRSRSFSATFLVPLTCSLLSIDRSFYFRSSFSAFMEVANEHCERPNAGFRRHNTSTKALIWWLCWMCSTNRQS